MGKTLRLAGLVAAVSVFVAACGDRRPIDWRDVPMTISDVGQERVQAVSRGRWEATRTYSPGYGMTFGELVWTKDDTSLTFECRENGTYDLIWREPVKDDEGASTPDDDAEETPSFLVTFPNGEEIKFEHWSERKGEEVSVVLLHERTWTPASAEPLNAFREPGRYRIALGDRELAFRVPAGFEIAQTLLSVCDTDRRFIRP